jgi:cytochrome c oxidase assembly protein subunit 15
MQNKLKIWLYIGCGMIFIMTLIGGITRLTHSGLSMVDWNLISGSIPPLNEAEWTNVFDKYKAYPEYKELNYQYTLSDFKSIFWWEYIHRMFGRLIGIVFIIPYAIFMIKGAIDKHLNKKLIIMFCLGAFQAFLGWFMVKSGLKDEPSVSHFRLAAHLITAFLTSGYIFWVARSIGRTKIRRSQTPVHKWSIALLGLLVLQIIWGAFVAGLKAGKAYNTWPLMEGGLYPAGIAEPTLINSFINQIAGVQFIHRYLAIIFSVVLITTWIKTAKTQLQGRSLLIGTLFIQFTLGVFTLIYSVPLILGVMHQLGAFILLLVVLRFIQQFYYSEDLVSNA